MGSDSGHHIWLTGAFSHRAISLTLHTHLLTHWPGDFDSHLTPMPVSYLPDELAENRKFSFLRVLAFLTCCPAQLQSSLL